MIDKLTGYRWCIIGFLGACLVLGAPPQSAWACVCIQPSLDMAFGGASAVFVAEADARESPFGTHATGVRMTVERVWKGEVPRKIYMVAGEYESNDGLFTKSSCDWLPRDGGRNLVFATEEDGYFKSWTCSGSGSWDGDEAPQFYAALVEAEGEGEPPNAELSDHVAPTKSTPSDSVPTSTVPAYATVEDLDDSHRSNGVRVGITPWLLLGLLAFLLGLVAVVVLRQRDRD